jgi:hypothetical protein
MSTPEESIHLIVYTSEYTGQPDTFGRDLQAIVASAKRNNRVHNITGAIFVHDGRFLEFLEGTETELRSLLKRISADTRHHNMKILFDDPISERGFGRWQLDSFNLSSGRSLQLDALEMIRDAYRRNFTTCSSLIVGIYKAFLEQPTLSI